MNLLEIFVAAVICVPAAALAYRRSPWLVDYTIGVVAFNRGIRRIVDYANGEFNRTSPVILASLIVAALAVAITLTELQSGRRLGRFGRRAVAWYFSAIAIAFIIGLIKNGAPALIELATYMGPLGMLGYGAMFSDSPKVLEQWARSAALIGIAVAVYGLYQFYTIPPWDAFWLRATDLGGYLGKPEPTKMTLYSTLAERGPAASFLAATTVVLLLRPGLLGSLRWPAAGLTGYAMLLAYSRTGLIQVGVATAALPFVGQRRVSGRVVPIVFVILLAAQLIGSYSPVADRLSNRYATLGNLSEDTSARARIFLFFKAVPVVATNPLGLGFGSTGAATRVSGAKTDTVIDATGYLKVFQLFGWIGGVLLFRVLWQAWKSSRFVIRHQPGDENATLFRAWLLAGMVTLIAGLWFNNAMFFWCLAGAMIGKHDAIIGGRASVRTEAAALPSGNLDLGPATAS